jgi:hypothetical protein
MIFVTFFFAQETSKIKKFAEVQNSFFVILLMPILLDGRDEEEEDILY